MNSSQKTFIIILIIAGILEFLLIIAATCYIFSTENTALGSKVLELKIELTKKDEAISQLEKTVKEKDDLILTLLDADNIPISNTVSENN